MNHNKVTLVGRLVKDPTFTNGDPSKNVDNRCFFQIAVNRSSAKDSPYDVFNVIAWGALADIVHRFCKKGKEVLVEGSLRTNNKKRADGSWDNYIEVVAKEIQLGHDAAASREEQPEETKSPSDVLGALKERGIDLDALTTLLAGAVAANRKAAPTPEPVDDFPM